MISLDFNNLHAVAPEQGVSFDALHGTANRIQDFLKAVEARGQGFYHVMDDEALATSIKNFAASVKDKFHHIVVLGIGGSALGALCLRQALTPLYGSTPKLFVLDNIDPAVLKSADAELDYSKTLFLVITKSGNTPETLSQYFYFRKKMEEKGLPPSEHFVFVTDPETGFLRECATAEPAIHTLPVPPNVGGRFSVLTAVGLLPAALIGIDVDGLLRGARSMRDRFLSVNFKENLSFQLAAAQFLTLQKGKSQHVLFPYAQHLLRFGDWYCQLVAESLGKALNERGEEVHTGITPLTAVGVTDQHSRLQLYQEGPNDKLFLFVEVDELAPSIEIQVPPEAQSHPAVSYLNGVTFDRFLHSALEGTRRSLTEHHRPNLTIHADTISAETIGELFVLFQGAVAFLGEFLGINAYNQPGVEQSKIITRQLL